MVKIDLVTGFLGSGKTTFIKKYAKYLMDCGNNICILENDYGAVNVDMMLLQDLCGDNCELEMVAGGCDYDCHRRRFKTKLISMGMCGYDRVIVEPSGIFDVDEFFDVLYEEPLNRWYEIGNVFAVVDAKFEKELSVQSEYLLASQTANAGKVILSRVQEASKEEIAATIEHINHAMELVKCKRIFDEEIVCLDWEKMTAEDFNNILNSGYVNENYVKLLSHDDQDYSSLYYMNVRMSVDELAKKAEAIMKDSACGKILRIKGFMLTETEQWVEINATKQSISIKPIEAGQEVIIVIGEELVEEMIGTYFK